MYIAYYYNHTTKEFARVGTPEEGDKLDAQGWDNITEVDYIFGMLSRLRAQNAKLISALENLIDATVQTPVDRSIEWANETSEKASQAIDAARATISEAQK